MPLEWENYSMLVRKLSSLFSAFALMVSGTVWLATPASAQQEKVLYSFGATPQDGTEPANLISDKAGNLYGIASEGAYGNGAIFELTPQKGGGWTEKIVHSFCSQPNCTDGDDPRGTLVFDTAGNLYGTTVQGGAYGIGSGGYGTVFELSPASGGDWTHTVLYSFGNGTDAAIPFSGLIFDASGNLYGTTTSEIYNGPYGYSLYSSGTVFELSQKNGVWADTLLLTFNDNGNEIYANLTVDAAGNFYTSTFNPGTAGTVIELRQSAGTWKQKVLSGSGNTSNLIFDAAGNLYGTQSLGGTYGGGVAFELSPKAGGGWTEKALYNFGGVNHGADGYQASSGLIFDSAGNLYGTTAYGGGGGQECGNGMGVTGCGTVYRLTPAQDGTWTETVVYLFGHGTNAKAGAYPCCGLLFDSAGNLYGTTLGGGSNDKGAVFEIKP